MKNISYHYTECGLDNIYLINGFNQFETPYGRAISINDIDGLHRAIGVLLITTIKDLSGTEIRFLRHEMLMSQKTLSSLLGVGEQEVRRWENGKIKMPKPSESLLRLLYREHIHDRKSKIASILKAISDLEAGISENQFVFKDTKNGWQAAA
jgi:DNA-binding transcriptional regulator YiaG